MGSHRIGDFNEREEFSRTFIDFFFFFFYLLTIPGSITEVAAEDVRDKNRQFKDYWTKKNVFIPQSSWCRAKNSSTMN